MPWLLRDDTVLASLRVAGSRADRRRGLLGLDGFDGALLFEHTRSVHSFGMRFPIDVAYCDQDLVVLKTMRVEPHRVTLPVMRASRVIEAEAGAFARWGLCVGDRLEVRGEHPDGQPSHPDPAPERHPDLEPDRAPDRATGRRPADDGD